MLDRKNKRFLIILGIIVAVAVVVIIIAVNAAQPRVINENDPVDYSSGKIEYSYYDAEADEQKTEIVEAGGEDTLRTVAENVAQSYFGQPLADSPMEPNSIKVEGDSLYYDFSSGMSQTNLGAASEVALLDSLAQGYKSNIDGIANVYFSMDGGDFVTGNTEWSKDTPFENEYGEVEISEGT